MSIEKHIVIKHLQKEIDFLKQIQKVPKKKSQPFLSNNDGIVVSLGPTILTKEATQGFYETLCQAWFESSSKLWNFTINPDPKKPSRSLNSKFDKQEYFGKIKDSLLKKRIGDFVSQLINSKKLHGVVEEAVLYWEYGDKSGKFHCNCTMKINPVVDDKTHYFIRNTMGDYFGGERSVYFKDGRKFKSQDIYNCKDAGFMAKLGHKPLHLCRLKNI